MWKLKHRDKDGSKGQPSSSPPPVVVLVIQADKYNWLSIFSGRKLSNGRDIKVVQVGWQDILIHADTYSSDTRPIVEVCKEGRNMTVLPDFVLVRNEVLTPTFDGRQLLSGLMFASIPSINSLESIYLTNDRAAMMGQLHRLNRKLGDEAFPVVTQHFASSSSCLMYGYTFPAVVKVGSAHAGAGKMKINDHHQMSDFRSVLTMMPNEHCFVEPFIEGAYDLRIQKIGEHVRAFQRRDISGEWKTNTGTSMMEEVPVEPRWKVWVDELKDVFGGLDIKPLDISKH